MIRVHAAGVNPADTYIRSGTYAFSQPDLPYTPGFDCGGVVQSVGCDVDSLTAGDRVFVAALDSAHSGAYAELMVCQAHTVRALPNHLSFEQGAAIGVPCIAAYRALFQRGGARHGETVLIHGASGGVGLPAVQMAAAEGLTVIGTAGTAEGRRLVLDNGAHYVLDHSAPN
nr:alcohol dehydrogenase catalytic domain-containing protein [Rhodococcus sp. LB1]